MSSSTLLSSRLGGLAGRYCTFAWVARLLFGTAYALVVAELFLRILVPQPILPRHVCSTSYGIRGNSPNQEYWHSTPDVYVRFRINSRGVRADREIPYEKPAGVKRVILLGDSFGMGYEADLENTFAARLEEYLNRAGVRCELVNLSVSGHGTAEELIVLREEAWKYQPDLVLLAWHCTDLEDNIRSRLFVLDGSHLVRKNAAYLPGMKTRERLERFAVYRFLEGHCHLYAFVRERAASLVKEIIVKRASLEARPAVSDSRPAESGPTPADLAVALLNEIERECRQRGAAFLVLSIPTRVSRTQFEESFPVSHPGARGLRVYSPIPRFEREKGKLLYWERSHFHFTPLGCRIVGEGLGQLILGENLLDAHRRAEPTGADRRP